MPTRLTLSAYVGPMPRPVVPILFLPRKRSVTLSIVEWYDAITCALALTTSRRTSTPRATSASSSRNSASGETTTPLRDHRGAAGGEDAAGQQVGGELLAVDHDGVAGVVAAAGADDVVDRSRWWRAGRSPCPCPRRPTGLRGPRSRASDLLLGSETDSAHGSRHGARQGARAVATIPHRGSRGPRRSRLGSGPWTPSS